MWLNYLALLKYKIFQLEYHYLKNLRHPHILHLHGVCRDVVASSLLILEYSEMGSLQQVNLLSISACNVGSNTWLIKTSTVQKEVEIFLGKSGENSTQMTLQMITTNTNCKPQENSTQMTLQMITTNINCKPQENSTQMTLQMITTNIKCKPRDGNRA